MISQFDHNLVSSFFLWVDNRLSEKGGAVITGNTQIFSHSSEGIDTPPNMLSFYSSERQFTPDHPNSPSGIYVNGSGFSQVTTGSSRVLIDHDQGRILFDTGIFTPQDSVSGQFVQKEINLYITNETEEEILVNKEFYLESGGSYMESINQIAKARYCLPCIFISNNFSENKGFSLGGTKDTKTSIRTVIFAESNYQLDGVISLLRDSSEKCFNIVSVDNFPYGEYWHIRDFPYRYSDFVGQNSIDKVFIKSVETSRLRDGVRTSKNNLRKDILIGYADFEISSIRDIN